MDIISAFVGLFADGVATIDLPKLDVVVGNLMKWMDSWIMNLGFTVVLFTVFLKLITFPLDFFSRRSMKIYQLKMEKIQPQIEKLKKQYANNKQLMQQKQMALQKKMGASALASCLPSLVTMVLFIYVFSAFTSYINYSNISTYNELATTYNEVVLGLSDEEIRTEEVQNKISEKICLKYEKMNRGFLWVKNVGIADVPWLQPVAADAPTFLGSMKDNININNDEYKKVMGPIIKSYTTEKGTMEPNGYLALPIIAVGMSLLTQLVTMKTQKSSNPMGEMNGQKTMMKVMMFIFPIMFLTFALTSSTAFTIYMATNTIITLGTTFLINFIVTRTVKLKEKKEVKQGVGRR